VELPRTLVLLKGITETGFSMPQGEAADMKALSFIDNTRFAYFLYHDFIVDIHIQDSTAGFNVFSNPGGTNNIEGIIPIYLRREHKEPRNTGNMIRMGMAYKNDRDFLPSEIESAKGYLGPLSRVK
jgi:hypothetical protein